MIILHGLHSRIMTIKKITIDNVFFNAIKIVKLLVWRNLHFHEFVRAYKNRKNITCMHAVVFSFAKINR